MFSIRDHILIDLSSHYKTALSEKINLLKTAVSGNRLVRFDYYSHKGHSARVIEPYLIIFRWASWYVFGYCRDRNDFRLFRLNRLWRHAILDDTFSPREIPEDRLDLDKYFSDENKITVLFDKSLEYRLIDEYGPGCYTEMEDGKLLFTSGYTNRDYIIGWVLGFGEKATVLEPLDLASEIKDLAKNIIRNYEHDI